MSPHPPTVVVVSRYGGVAGVLVEVLDAAGIAVAATAALDVDGLAAVGRALTDADVVVVTAAPADPTAGMAVAGRPAQAVVAVTWHPEDEQVPLPEGVRRVRAGRIRWDLAAAVAAAGT